ncbi:hypothetical protein AAY473_030800, partial [Plecturocebus cupreus]
MAGTTGMSHYAMLIVAFFFLEMGFRHVAQAGLELLDLSEPLSLASQSAGVTEVSHCTWPSGGPLDLLFLQLRMPFPGSFHGHLLLTTWISAQRSSLATHGYAVLLLLDSSNEGYLKVRLFTAVGTLREDQHHLPGLTVINLLSSENRSPRDTGFLDGISGLLGSLPAYCSSVAAGGTWVEVTASGSRPGPATLLPPVWSVGTAMRSCSCPVLLGDEGAGLGSVWFRSSAVRVTPLFSFFSESFSPSSSCSRSPSSLSLFSSFSPSSVPSLSLVGDESPSGPGEAKASVAARTGLAACLLAEAAVGRRVGHTVLGKEEMPPPPNPRPARSVLVTTEATVAWLPLEEGPIPVAMDTNEKGMPEDVQVEDPELMGAMSAEDAGDAVGWEGSPGKGGKEAEGKAEKHRAVVRSQLTATSASRVQAILLSLSLPIFVETGSHCVAQACLVLLTTNNPPASASQSAGIAGTSHRTWSKTRHRPGLGLQSFLNTRKGTSTFRVKVDTRSMKSRSYLPGWHAMVPSRITVTFASRIQAILLPHPPKELGLQ